MITATFIVLLQFIGVSTIKNKKTQRIRNTTTSPSILFFSFFFLDFFFSLFFSMYQATTATKNPTTKKKKKIIVLQKAKSHFRFVFFTRCFFKTKSQQWLAFDILKRRFHCVKKKKNPNLQQTQKSVLTI